MAESSLGAAAGADYVDVLPAVADEGSDGRTDRAEFSSTTEKAFAGVLAEVLGVELVPMDGDFFDDLGADSLVMARFCARVRKRPDLPNVAIKDIYRAPTIAALAVARAPDVVGRPTPTQAGTPPVRRPPAPVPTPRPVQNATRTSPVGTLRYLLCGT